MTVEFRHVSNLKTPYDELDVKLLAALGDEGADYQIGDPIEAKTPGANSLAVLKETGIVGLYVTQQAIQKPNARSIGWYVPVIDVWQHLPVLNG